MAKALNEVKSFKDLPAIVSQSYKPNMNNKTTAERFTNMREEFCPLKVIPKIVHDSYVSEEINQEITLHGGEKKDIEVPILLFKPSNNHIGGIFSAVDKSFQFGSFFVGIFDYDILEKYRVIQKCRKEKKEKEEKIKSEKDTKIQEQLQKEIDGLLFILRENNSDIIYPSFDKVNYNIKFTKNYHPRFYIIPRSEMTPGKNINFPSKYGMSHKHLNDIRDEVFIGHFQKLRIKHGIDKPDFNSYQQHLFQSREFNYVDVANNIRWYKVKGLNEFYAIDVTKSTDAAQSEHYGIGSISDQNLVWKDNVQKKLLPIARRMISKIIDSK